MKQVKTWRATSVFVDVPNTAINGLSQTRRIEGKLSMAHLLCKLARHDLIPASLIKDQTSTSPQRTRSIAVTTSEIALLPEVALPTSMDAPPRSATSHRKSYLDPRLYQIAALASLLIYGCFGLGFDTNPKRCAAIIGTALLAQWIFGRLYGIARFDPKSALISGLSLTLLLRTRSMPITVAIATIAIASKFLLRFRGKHLFNPTNVALVAGMLLFGNAVWISPGQWGNTAFFGFLLACIGGLVVTRAARADVTCAWFVFYAGLLIARSLWLGEPLAIPFHRLQSGGLLLFGFFMISDPKTTPNSRAGRLIFSALTAFIAWWIQFRLFRTNGVLWALAISAFATPLLDLLLPGKRYAWAPSQIKKPSQRELTKQAPAMAPGA